jgi:alpha,alpha-trehalase
MITEERSGHHWCDSVFAGPGCTGTPDHPTLLRLRPHEEVTMSDTPLELASNRWSAAIFDLDGVITRTATVHSAAWKMLFDDYLADRPPQDGEDHSEFTQSDYRRFVDGLPRYDGVQRFLSSRGISLPWGKGDDPPARETVCGIGNRKNQLFRERLREAGVEIFAPAVQLVEALRRAGVATAVVSSSKNTRAVLEAGDLERLFDVCVDGVEAERLGLDGKPAPDVFIEAARRLGVTPSDAIVLEDADAGVEAGRRGSFGLVIGLDRDDRGAQLREAGADVVLKNLEEVTVTPAEEAPSDQLPSALDRIDEIRASGRMAVFLDYDGTLTPIVERPEDAVLSDGTRSALVDLAEVCPVAIVSGRDLDEVREMVSIDSIHYAGSHGFDIAGPEVTAQRGTEYLPDLDQAQHELEVALATVPRTWVERKRFSVAVHYRQADPADEPAVQHAVTRVHTKHQDRLAMSSGKKIFELRPAIDWHKGRALSWLADQLGLDEPDRTRMYIGDDTTDEDAFREIADDGIGIVVTDTARRTAASYRLRGPSEVRTFLQEVAGSMAPKGDSA